MSNSIRWVTAVSLALACPAFAQGILGEDSGPHANDGQCDDSRFLEVVAGGSATFQWSDGRYDGRDATDCRDLLLRGLITWRLADVQESTTGDAVAKVDEALATWVRAYASLPDLPICEAHPEFSDIALTCLQVAFEDGSTLNPVGLMAGFTPWVNGERQGTAVFLYESGDISELPLANDQPHGTLVIRSPDGTVVERCYRRGEEMHDGPC